MTRTQKNSEISKFKICSVGEPMIELAYEHGDEGLFFFGVAGDTLNTAVYLKRILAACADVCYLTILGGDPLSKKIQDFIESEGIDSRFIRTNSGKNCGIYLIQNDDHGERTFHYWREKSAARTLFYLETDFQCLEVSDIIYFSGISLAILNQEKRIRLLHWLESKAQTKTILFDVNFRKSLWPDLKDARETLKRAMKISTICFPSREDLLILFGSTENLCFLKKYCKNVGEFFVVKNGGMESPEIILPEGPSVRLPSFKKCRKVKDATGAGDSFNAGFISAYLMGKSLSNSLSHGNDLAQITLKTKGAICSERDIEKFKLEE